MLRETMALSAVVEPMFERGKSDTEEEGNEECT